MKTRRAWYLAAALGAAVGGCSNNSWSSGDRVLVTKCAYETKLQRPERFNVVVFKYPERPLEDNTPKNYIKRLLGLPGEIIAIFFGRLFRFAPPGEPPPLDDQDQVADPKTLWRREHMHVNHPKSRALFEEGRFDIIRKPPDVMLALRRIVYDNDFQPKDEQAEPRWAPRKGSGWAPDKAHGFRHAGAKSEQVDWLRYRHLLWYKNGGPLAGHKEIEPELITDFLGYNSIKLGDFGGPQTPPPNWVGDLMLECQVEAKKGEGEFWLELNKGINQFRAKWDLGSGMCTLYRIEHRVHDEGGKTELKQVAHTELDSKPTKLRGPGTYLVRFANVDARLTVWVDRELPFGDGKEYPPPEVKCLRESPQDKDLDPIELQRRRGPTKNDLEPASIGVHGADVQVHQLKLWRDTYYTLGANSSDVGLLPNELSNPEKWAAFRTMDFKTLYVQPGHYLCLGDNSQASSDGRDWGLVPDRLMLGRALLVYYPFSRAGPIR